MEGDLIKNACIPKVAGVISVLTPAANFTTVFSQDSVHCQTYGEFQPGVKRVEMPPLRIKRLYIDSRNEFPVWYTYSSQFTSKKASKAKRWMQTDRQVSGIFCVGQEIKAKLVS